MKSDSVPKMTGLLVILLLVGLWMMLCAPGSANSTQRALSEDEKHRLYSAALAASETPLDTDTFKKACRKIGIFDANGKPNDHYMAFVSQHVNWSMKTESDQFRNEINSKEKAREYIAKHLSGFEQ